MKKTHQKNYRFHAHTVKLIEQNAYRLSTPGDMKTETDAVAIGQQVLNYLLNRGDEGRAIIGQAFKSVQEIDRLDHIQQEMTDDAKQ